ncbi:hypothetical protein [Curtobacterium sp. ISL-83]|uniref:hypothetical protein n=1 Tax=Curtobacterium sp. ISL-83 TaxID=2819145 RepID=UPI001BE7B722|nr:hypothetical protein [Curtobacterium sp. ISL-83]MBT2501407.1 hypothetical protein [Curtobacterium sp. ISL-83]
MGEDRDMDDLLAAADPVEAPPRTARRAVGLAVALLGAAGVIAVTLTALWNAVTAAVVRAAIEKWAGY